MLITKSLFLFTMAFGVLFVSMSTHESSAEYLSPRQQWEKFADPDMLICKDGLVLLQKKWLSCMCYPHNIREIN